MGSVIQWINALAIVVLVGVTAWYARETRNIAKATREQAEGIKEQAQASSAMAEATKKLAEEAEKQRHEMARPVLVFRRIQRFSEPATGEVEPDTTIYIEDPNTRRDTWEHVELTNVGKGPAVDIKISGEHVLAPLGVGEHCRILLYKNYLRSQPGNEEILEVSYKDILRNPKRTLLKLKVKEPRHYGFVEILFEDL